MGVNNFLTETNGHLSETLVEINGLEFDMFQPVMHGIQLQISLMELKSMVIP